MKTLFITTLLFTALFYGISLLILFTRKLSWGFYCIALGLIGPIIFTKKIWEESHLITVAYLISLSLLFGLFLFGKITGNKLI